MLAAFAFVSILLVYPQIRKDVTGVEGPITVAEAAAIGVLVLMVIFAFEMIRLAMRQIRSQFVDEEDDDEFDQVLEQIQAWLLVEMAHGKDIGREPSFSSEARGILAELSALLDCDVPLYDFDDDQERDRCVRLLSDLEVLIPTGYEHLVRDRLKEETASWDKIQYRSPDDG